MDVSSADKFVFYVLYESVVSDVNFGLTNFLLVEESEIIVEACAQNLR